MLLIPRRLPPENLRAACSNRMTRVQSPKTIAGTHSGPRERDENKKGGGGEREGNRDHTHASNGRRVTDVDALTNIPDLSSRTASE